MFKKMFNNCKAKILYFLMLAAAWLQSMFVPQLRPLWVDKRGDGSMNFLITVVISVAIAAILIGVISAAVPGFWDTIQERITGLLGA